MKILISKHSSTYCSLCNSPLKITKFKNLHTYIVCINHEHIFNISIFYVPNGKTIIKYIANIESFVFHATSSKTSIHFTNNNIKTSINLDYFIELDLNDPLKTINKIIKLKAFQ